MHPQTCLIDHAPRAARVAVRSMCVRYARGSRVRRARFVSVPRSVGPLELCLAMWKKAWQARGAQGQHKASDSTMAGVVWAWSDDHHVWKAYTPELCKQLEHAFADASRRDIGIYLHGGGQARAPSHVVNFDKMVQVNVHTQMRRPVRREEPVVGGGSWCFEDKSWVAYDAVTSSQVSAAEAAGRPGTTVFVMHGSWQQTYYVDLRKRTQTNLATSMQRRVRFEPFSQPGPTRQPMPSAAPSSNAAVPQQQVAINFVATSAASLDLAQLTRWTVVPAGAWEAGATDPIMLSELGEDSEDVVRLPCHTDAVSCTFNISTVESAFRSANACPVCGTKYHLPGPQPTGSMAAAVDHTTQCEGHDGSGSIVIHYDFPDGMQQPQHPRPGQPYSGTQRTAFLPDDEVGRRCLALLAAAFEQGALFRVGDSSTTGRRDVVVWAIHQKTNPGGGPTSHGWPDAGYLQRLQSECAAAGVDGALQSSS